jgi:hypothetical protein
MIKKWDAGFDGRFAFAINVQLDLDARFFGYTPDACAPDAHDAAFNQTASPKTKPNRRLEKRMFRTTPN